MDPRRTCAVGNLDHEPLSVRGSFSTYWARGSGARRAYADGGVFAGGRRMKIAIPELSLVMLVGPSGCGKSSFGRKHFLPTEVVSSDFCRGLVSDNQNDQ